MLHLTNCNESQLISEQFPRNFWNFPFCGCSSAIIKSHPAEKGRKTIYLANITQCQQKENSENSKAVPRRLLS